MKVLQHISFSAQADRVLAVYDQHDDALRISMLGQEYVVRHDGIHLRGQKAPESHAAIIIDYCSSAGTTLAVRPWRSMNELFRLPGSDFREKVEQPLSTHAPDIIARMKMLLPMIDAEIVPSLINSELSIVVHALPKVYLHVELFQETQDFPAEVWVLFSNNANEFLTVGGALGLAEAFKDRLLSLLRIY